MTNRDCKHGQQARACQICDLEGERDTLRTQLEAIRAAGGEEPKVVAEVVALDHGFIDVVLTRGPKSAVPGQPSAGSDLMTVAQHQRIVAAMAAELERLKRDNDYVSENLEVAHAERMELRAELEAARKQEPVQVVAVAVMRDDGDGGLVPDWLLEGGTAEMVEGMLLLAADDTTVTGEDGHGEVFKLPPLAGKVAVPRELLETLVDGIDDYWRNNAGAEAFAELRTLLAGQQTEQEPSNGQ